MAEEKALGLSVLSTIRDWVKSLIPSAYADSPSAGGNATRTNGILYGEVDSTSTSTAFTATISGLTELVDGTTIMLKNGVVTSASGFTININNLGAKPCYSNMATGNDITPTAPTRDTTIFNINYTMLLIYSEDIVDGGGWICYRGYDANTNTIGYQLRTNSSSLPTTKKFYRYRILFTSPDGAHFVPSNTSTSTNATAKRDVNQEKIDPFGRIVYYNYTTAIDAGSRPGVTYLMDQMTMTFGYAFNRTGAALTLTAWKPIFIKCAPQTDGSAIIDADTPYVQDLPSTADGKIYIFLGVAYSATAVELMMHHPVYYHDGTSVRQWVGRTIPTKTSDLTNDSGFLTSAVTSVNGNSGAVTVVEGLEPLIGDVDEITPAQVRTAVLEGRDVSIAAIGQLQGVNLELEFTSFNCAKDVPASGAIINVVISQTIARYDNVYYLFELVGGVGAGWNVISTALAQLTDIPENVSDLNNDAGYITGYTETDPTVPSWAKAATKPSYTASEVGAIPTTGGDVDGGLTLKSAAATNSPSLIFQRGTLTDNYNDWQIQDRGGFLYFDQRGQGSSDFSNQVCFNTSGNVTATSFTGSGASLTSLNASNLSSGTVPAARLDLSGYVPTTRTVNGKALSSDVTLSASDVSALSDTVTSLKNPQSLKIILGGTTYEYDGSQQKTITISSATGVSF